MFSIPQIAAVCMVVACQPALAEAPQAVALEAITISASPLGVDRNAVATPVEVLDGSQLMLSREATLGATLAGLPGVRADTFGAGASRPVIRGQNAPRVAILSDGSAVMDASAISPDHAVGVEPMLASRIEVLRGPATLLYGGGSIGGVVNVIDSKVPQRVPEGGVEGFAEVNGATGSGSRASAFGITAGQNNFAVHVEGMKRRADDYRVPHWSESRVNGSRAKSDTGSVGMSWVGDSGYLGLAYTYTESEYGLPGHTHEYEGCHPHAGRLHCGGDGHEGHGHGHGHEAHDHNDSEHHAVPYVRLKTERIDLRGEAEQPLPGIRKLRLRGGFTDYRHREIEGAQTATTFVNRGYDMRLEAEHEAVAGWRGVLGLQGARSDFSALGRESFLPQTRTESVGLFLLEEYRLNNWRFEVGARHDWQIVRPDDSRPAARLQGTSVSGSAVWNFVPGYSAALSASRTHRLPSAQELYADGVHLATNTYELGNPYLQKETSHNLDLTLRKHAGDLQLGLSLFYNRVRDYIYADTLDRHDDFRLIEYRQADAQFIGFEANAHYQFNRYVTAGVFGDMVRARFTDGQENLPRIPAARAGVRVKTVWKNWSGNLEWYRTFRQDRLAAYEDETSGYSMFNASIAYTAALADADYTVYLRATNLFNQLAYNHTSFIKSAAPLAGRQIMLGMRIEY